MPLPPPVRPLVASFAAAVLASAVAAQPAPPRLPELQPERPAGRDAERPAGRRPAPGERPAASVLGQWFAELADADAAVRDAARMKLMGMRREDLAAFEGVVRESLPLMPSQAAVLRRIVTHVFLTGEPYQTTELEGFLGVKMQETSVRVPSADEAEPFAPAVGVVIVDRMPGFAGARMLRDGDVILGVVERPDVRTMGTHEFTLVVRAVTPGSTIHFQVMRQGQIIRVPVAPDPRPFQADAIQELINLRQHLADEYWEKSFAKLLNEGVG